MGGLLTIGVTLRCFPSSSGLEDALAYYEDSSVSESSRAKGMRLCSVPCGCLLFVLCSCLLFGNTCIPHMMMNRDVCFERQRTFRGRGPLDANYRKGDNLTQLYVR